MITFQLQLHYLLCGNDLRNLSHILNGGKWTCHIDKPLKWFSIHREKHNVDEFAGLLFTHAQTITYCVVIRRCGRRTLASRGEVFWGESRWPPATLLSKSPYPAYLPLAWSSTCPVKSSRTWTCCPSPTPSSLSWWRTPRAAHGERSVEFVYFIISLYTSLGLTSIMLSLEYLHVVDISSTKSFY